MGKAGGGGAVRAEAVPDRSCKEFGKEFGPASSRASMAARTALLLLAMLYDSSCAFAVHSSTSARRGARPAGQLAQSRWLLCMRSRPPVCMQPEEEVDSKLVAADATLIFAFSFARTLSTILVSPDFGTAAEPGWLAPIRTPLDPDFNFERASATLYFAGEWAVCWIAAGVLLATFASGSADSSRRCGPEGALRCAGLSTAFLAAFVLAASAICAPGLPPASLQLSLDNVAGSLGIGITLVAWRKLLLELY
jgi:hypothetical protein